MQRGTAAVVVGALLVAACSAGSDSDPPQSVTTVPTTPVTAAGSSAPTSGTSTTLAGTPEERFVWMMRDLASETGEETWVGAFSDEEVADYGKAKCSALDDGATFAELGDDTASTAAEFNLTEADITLAMQSIMVATMSICPQHQEAFLEWVGSGAPGAETAPGGFDNIPEMAEEIRRGRTGSGPDQAWFLEAYELTISASDWADELLGEDEAVLGAETFCSMLADLPEDADPYEATGIAILETGFLLGVSDPHALLLATVAAGAMCPDDRYAIALEGLRRLKSAER